MNKTKPCDAFKQQVFCNLIYLLWIKVSSVPAVLFEEGLLA